MNSFDKESRLGRHMNKKMLGHILALITVFIWGITFVSTKILLDYYTPLAIMVLRFSLAYVALWMIHPKHYPLKNMKEELNFVVAGLTGVSAYFILENTALIYTSVSNTGLILASAPLFVALVSHFFTADEKFHSNILYGFLFAMAGVALVIFNGQVNLKLNPFGDVLAILSAMVWAIYSLTIKRMNQDDSPVYLTRRTFFYGILTGLFFLVVFEGGFDLKPLITEGALFHVAFLGLLASGACYVMWNHAIRIIGAVKTSNYIYLMPLFTMIASAVVLKEKINFLMIMGGALILVGVYITENGFTRRMYYAKDRIGD